MDDAKDDYPAVLNTIEQSVPAMGKAANAFAKFGFKRTHLRKFSKSRESVFEAARVVIGRLLSKLPCAPLVDFRQIGTRLRADAQFNYSGHGARR